MKIVIQRVSSASVTVENQTIGAIQQGYLVLLGIRKGDSKEDVDRIVHKLLNLRIFADENGKTNLSIQDVHGSLLVVSQFTLYANCKKGNRPSFTDTAEPDAANALYQYFIKRCREVIPHVEHGEFGADMKVSLVNDGPFTVILDQDFL